MPADGNIVEVLSTMLAEFTKKNDIHRNASMSKADSNAARAMFEAYQVPSITIEQYFTRLDKYFHNSDECYVYSLILVDRLINRHPKMYLTSHNVHRLLVTAIIISAKVRDDSYYSNKYYSDVAGLRLSELNYLEMHFLHLLDFELYVSFEDFLRYILEIHDRYGPITGYHAQFVAQAELMDEDEEEEGDENDDNSESQGDHVMEIDEALMDGTTVMVVEEGVEVVITTDVIVEDENGDVHMLEVQGVVGGIEEP